MRIPRLSHLSVQVMSSKFTFIVRKFRAQILVTASDSRHPDIAKDIRLRSFKNY